MKKAVILLLPAVIAIAARPQAVQKKAVQKKAAAAAFSDTVYDFAFDSLRHNMGYVNPGHSRLEKKFKYLGHAPAGILRAWTGDPHFICEFPNTPLLPGREYSFTVCFSFSGRGPFYRQMGFVLRDESIITLTFCGEVQALGR
jgi:hypothetical protein